MKIENLDPLMFAALSPPFSSSCQTVESADNPPALPNHKNRSNSRSSLDHSRPVTLNRFESPCGWNSLPRQAQLRLVKPGKGKKGGGGGSNLSSNFDIRTSDFLLIRIHPW